FARCAPSSASCSTTTACSRGPSTQTGRCRMSSARYKALWIACAAATALLSCATPPGGGKSSDGINLGSAGPHVVQPLPDKPHFGQPIAEADVARWNIDIRSSDGMGLPAGRGTVAEGRKVYDAKCASCHG